MSFRCIVQFAQAHAEFRLPELQSVSELYHFDIQQPADEEWDPLRPFWIVDLEKEEHATLLATRCILVKSIMHLYAHGASYEVVHEQALTKSHLWEKYMDDTSFRFTVVAYNHTIPKARQKEVVEEFKYMGLRGKIDLKTPDITFNVFEEYADHGRQTLRHKHEGDGSCIHIYFGRLISEGTARSLIQKFDVKKRAYHGNTSMEAEISLLMANQTLSSPGKFIYDPFMGTGSMAYTAAQFGSYIFGSDIDGRQMRGKGGKTGIMVSASQYNLTDKIIDLCTFDVTNNPLRCGELFDAILTDPPYGVRAGAKRLGRKNPERRIHNRSPHREAQSRALESYVPPTKPYELSHLVKDLVLFARYLLKPGGRLVFFLPTVTDEYTEVDIHTMLCEGMVLIANSLQDFGSWGRRLITIKKVTTEKYPSPFDQHFATQEDSQPTEFVHVPSHKDFREKYFKGFKKDEETVSECRIEQDPQ